MRGRSVTIGTNASYPLDEGPFDELDAFQRRVRTRFREAGLEVQTVRLATQPFSALPRGYGVSETLPFAQALEALCWAHGIDYCSIGPVLATSPGDDLGHIDAIPAVIRQTETVFTSVPVASRASGICLEAIFRCAEVIHETAQSTPDGFGNLRMAVLANGGPGSPFFPVAYHEGSETGFSIATEATDLVVEAFSRAASLKEARASLWDDTFPFSALDA